MFVELSQIFYRALSYKPQDMLWLDIGVGGQLSLVPSRFVFFGWGSRVDLKTLSPETRGHLPFLH